MHSATVRLFLALILLCSATYAATINFSVFPGTDNTLGTGDDVATAPSESAIQFTTQYSQLYGGTGVMFDSLQPPNTGLASVWNFGNGTFSLCDARPDVSPTTCSFANMQMRFVSSADGTTPVSVGEATMEHESKQH